MDRLYRRIACAARAKALYASHGVSDTARGRFESLTLHLILVLRRLRSLPPPADELAQDLVDVAFRELDRGLRELGVGDLSVPKTMRALAGAFYGRAAVYEAALEQGNIDVLAAALARNVTAGDLSSRSLAAYVSAADGHLAKLDLVGILEGEPLFPSPASRGEVLDG